MLKDTLRHWRPSPTQLALLGGVAMIGAAGLLGTGDLEAIAPAEEKVEFYTPDQAIADRKARDANDNMAVSGAKEVVRDLTRDALDKGREAINQHVPDDVRAAVRARVAAQKEAWAAKARAALDASPAGVPGPGTTQVPQLDLKTLAPPPVSATPGVGAPSARAEAVELARPRTLADMAPRVGLEPGETGARQPRRALSDDFFK